MRINMTRIGRRLPRNVPRIRFLRSWRGYPVGAVIAPPGGFIREILQAHDQLGNKVAELVDPPLEEAIPDEPFTEDATSEDTPKPKRSKKAKE